jgi:hypothetical protein
MAARQGVLQSEERCRGAWALRARLPLLSLVPTTCVWPLETASLVGCAFLANPHLKQQEICLALSSEVWEIPRRRISSVI